jgi:serine/threonine-protein phosphatase 2A regulatory subunit B
LHPNSASSGNLVKFGNESTYKSNHNFFTDLISSIHSINFTKNNKYLISRDYLNIKIWDLNNTKKPIHNICIEDNLKTKLVNLFENDNIYDKFNISSSYDSNTIVSGNYNNCFHLINL